MAKYFLLGLIVLSIFSFKTIQSKTENNYIKINETQFQINGKPFYFLGTNFWSAMNLAAGLKVNDRNKLIRELDRLQLLGINNIRIMALSEGPDSEPFRIIPSNNNNTVLNENILKGLDFLLVEMQKRNMYAVACLSNFWPWSGGFIQYLKWAKTIDTIHYPMDEAGSQDWDKYQQTTAKFYSDANAMNFYKKSIQQIINRKNSLTKILYKNDPTIMSWELCNEPRGMKNVKDYLLWIDESAKFIKSLDNNHLVTVGSEGLDAYQDYNGTPFIKTHQSKYIDYTTAHLWVQNWNWYNPQKHDSTYPIAIKKTIDYLKEHIDLAVLLKKPFVLEEFGIGRDGGSFNISATTKTRDDFYEKVFQAILDYAKLKKASGVNFWSWSGENRPKNYGGWWKNGDDFTGDPPHEKQGWYSVYDSDTSTLQLIKKYTTLFKDVK